MATGASAPVVREIINLTAGYLLPKEKFEVPTVAWFSALRESLGVEADLYTYMKIAAAKDILQLGFDETEISGESTLNIWVKIQAINNEEEICHLSTGEFLEGGTADMVVDHIERKFVQAQAGVEKVWAVLKSKGHDADEQLSKVVFFYHGSGPWCMIHVILQMQQLAS